MKIHGAGRAENQHRQRTERDFMPSNFYSFKLNALQDVLQGVYYFYRIFQNRTGLLDTGILNG